MLKMLKEVTHWNVDFRQPNHTYLLNGKGQILAYARWHSDTDIDILKSRSYLDKRYRKFIEVNHTGLSKLIPNYIKEEKNSINNIIPDNTRIFKVKSKDNEYQVLLKNNQYSCSCIGYGYRGKCKHIDAVAKKQQVLKKSPSPLDILAEVC
jgi:hypothetical protein